jgi:hypothetical protein
MTEEREQDNGQAATDARQKAFASFLAAEPMPVADWPAMESEIEQEYCREHPD